MMCKQLDSRPMKGLALHRPALIPKRERSATILPRIGSCRRPTQTIKGHSMAFVVYNAEKTRQNGDHQILRRKSLTISPQVRHRASRWDYVTDPSATPCRSLIDDVDRFTRRRRSILPNFGHLQLELVTGCAPTRRASSLRKYRVQVLLSKPAGALFPPIIVRNPIVAVRRVYPESLCSNISNLCCGQFNGCGLQAREQLGGWGCPTCFFVNCQFTCAAASWAARAVGYPR